MFTGFIIPTSLVIKFFLSTYKNSSEYLIIIYIMLIIYSISSIIIGRIGLNLNHTKSPKSARAFLIGVIFLNVFLTMIFIVNFARTIDIALQNPFNSNQQSFNINEDEK